MKFLCKILGHDLSEPVKVITNFGFYMARCCERCDKRFPISIEDAKKKNEATAYVSSVMNGARAKLRLPPISWDN